MDTIGYCMRLQALEGYREKITMLAACDEYRVVFSVRHTGKKNDNPHYHVVIVTSVKAQAFRVRMKKIFADGRGNEHMSIKRYDGDIKAFSYCYHETGVEEFVRKGLTDDQIREFKEKNASIKKEVDKAKDKASWTLEQDCIDYFKEWTHVPTDREVADRLVRIAFERGKYVPNPFLARQIIANVRYKLCDGDLTKEDNVVRSIVDRIVPL